MSECEQDAAGSCGTDTTNTKCEEKPPEPEPSTQEDDYKLETAPFDPRFPNTNQTKHCYSSFLDYKKCVALRGEDYAPCEYFKRVYTSMCPHAWVDKWENQIEEGKFPHPLPS